MFLPGEIGPILRPSSRPALPVVMREVIGHKSAEAIVVLNKGFDTKAMFCLTGVTPKTAVRYKASICLCLLNADSTENCFNTINRLFFKCI